MGAKKQGEIPLETIFSIFGAMPHIVFRPHIDGAVASVFVVYPAQKTVIFAPIHNIVVCWIHRDVAAFTACSRLEITVANSAAVRAVRNPDAAVVLLRPVYPEWDRVIC